MERVLLERNVSIALPFLIMAEFFVRSIIALVYVVPIDARCASRRFLRVGWLVGPGLYDVFECFLYADNGFARS